MVGRSFRVLTSSRVRRDVFYSVPKQGAAIEGCIAQRNRQSKPFVWTAKSPGLCFCHPYSDRGKLVD